MNVEDIMAKIGDAVDAYRHEKRMTLEELAAKAKVSKVLLSQVEKKTLKNTTLDKLSGIVEAIEMDLEITLIPKEKGQ